MPVTPSDSPSAPAQYDAVPVQDFNIQAPQRDLSASVAAAVAAATGPRQAQAKTLLSGSDASSVTAGYSGDWPSDSRP